MQKKLSRRDVLKTAAAVGGAVFAQPLKAAAPEATPVTPALIEAARREGKLAFYTALELNISEKLGKAFEAKYPGIAVRVERSGAERIFQRIGQEQDSRINAVDLVCRLLLEKKKKKTKQDQQRKQTSTKIRENIAQALAGNEVRSRTSSGTLTRRK